MSPAPVRTVKPSPPPTMNELAVVVKLSAALFGIGCELSPAANERYLEALAVVESSTPLGEWSGPLCHRLVQDGRRDRALNPLGEEDARRLEFVGRGEHRITGFRHRDVRRGLHGGKPKLSQRHNHQRRCRRQRCGVSVISY